MIFGGGTTGSVITAGGEQVPAGDVSCEDVQCQVIPTYTYSAKDSFSTTTVTGSTNIKEDGRDPVSTLANPQKCETLQYWVDNSTYFCEVASEDSVACGSQSVQAKCFNNVTTTTMSVFDVENDRFLTDGDSGATNVSLAADATANIEFRYKGAAKKSSYPFGGCMVVEVPSTVSSITASGAGIENSKACPYVLTYTVSSTSNTFRAFEIPAGWDSDGKGDQKTVDIQLLASSSDPSGVGYITAIPANYYVTNAGDVVLGLEKDQNQDTTRTFGGAGAEVFGIN